MHDHQCEGDCEELAEFLRRLTHDALSLLTEQRFQEAKRLLLGFGLCLTNGKSAIDERVTLDHRDISVMVRRVADTIRRSVVVTCKCRNVTLVTNARQLELALCAIAADASHYRYENETVELRCDCGTEHVSFTVSYDGRPPGEAEVIPVPHLPFKRVRSPFRSDAGISTQVAEIAAAANEWTLERIEKQERQACRLTLNAQRRS